MRVHNKLCTYFLVTYKHLFLAVGICLINRRKLLISTGWITIFSAFPKISSASLIKSAVIKDAYSLWYNRPSVAELSNGFCVGYVTSTGHVCTANISDQLVVSNISILHKHEDASDHGSPTLLNVPSGKYSGHILACFSNHSTPLLCARTNSPGSIDNWDKVSEIDSGKSTYASLSAHTDGKIILMYTLQELAGEDPADEGRKTVARTSVDGGNTWSEPVVIVGLSPGNYPYSTALSMSPDGKCAMTYAIYNSKSRLHRGLTLVVTNDAFESKIEIPIDLGDDIHADTIPFETKWLSRSLVAVLFSQMSYDGKTGIGRVALVDFDSKRVISNTEVSTTAVHTYAGGLAISNDGRSVIYSPVVGGLVRKDLETGDIIEIIDSGDFSSPSLVNVRNKQLIIALKNPLIKRTRDFSAEIIIICE